MPVSNETKETTLKYRVDARGLDDLKRGLDKAFDKRTIDAVSKGLASYAKHFKAAREEAEKLTKGSAERAANEKKVLDNLLRQISVEEKLAAIRRAVAADEARANRGTAFRQGLYQGFGGPVANYMHRRANASTQEERDEMRAQFVGQMLGGAGRGVLGLGSRAVGAASAMVSGQGPLSTLLGNIPFIGGAAQLAESSVQRAVNFERSRTAALPFIGGFEGYNPGRLVKGTPGTPDSSTMATVIPGSLTEKRRQSAIGTATQRTMELPSSGNPIEMLLAKQVNETLGAGVKDIVQKAQGIVTTPGKPGTPDRRVGGTLSDYYAAGNRALLSREQTMQALGEVGRGVGGRVSADTFGQVEAARAYYGVDRGLGAQVFRQSRPGRGGADDTDALARGISDALRTGLEGSEVSEYLERLVGLQEQAAERGMKISTESFGGTSGMLRAAGLEGPQAGRVAAQFTTFGQNLSDRGASSPVDIALLRAAGFDPSKGGDSYIDALEAAESPTPDMLFKLISNLSAGGGGSKRTGFSLRRALGSVGVSLSSQQGRALAEAAEGGMSGFKGRLEGLGIGTVGADGKFQFNPAMTGKEMEGKLDTAAFRELAGLQRSQIAVDNNLLIAGQNAAKQVQALEVQFADLTKIMSTLSNTKITDGLVQGIITISQNIGELVELLRRAAGAH